VTTPFDRKIAGAGFEPLRADRIDTIQVNVGKLCNQACRHCHVDAGPNRTEVMTRETMAEILDVLRRHAIGTVDITGGAPEMNPHFDWFVGRVAALERHLIVRHNFTVLFEEGREHLPELFRRHRVEVIASLPHYSAERTDAQRGSHVFERSIEAMRRLNAAGYGEEGSGLELHLVFNPTGAFLPPAQASLEREFKERLARQHGVRFNRLYTIVNMPISRFRGWLERTGNLASYMGRLEGAYNPATVEHVMCRNLISVGWDGVLYDCDFNQMLEMAIRDGKPGPAHVRDLDPGWAARRVIRTGDHCYGCTAGAGSSCGGALADD